MIYLTEKDILQAVCFNDLLDAIEASMYMYENKEFHMPKRLHVDYEDNTLLLMPCFTKDCFGTKLVSLFPQNPEKNLPVLTGIMVLNDAQTGLPLALLNGPALTALRTAAVGSVSIRRLTPDNIQSLGIIGAGVQGFYQAWVACSARDLKDIYVFDLYAKKTTAMIEKLSKVIPDVNLHQANCVEDLLDNSQTVITATTSFEPVLPNEEELLSDKHFVGIGSYKPNMREFPEAVFSLLNMVFIDTDHALEESGDLIVPLQNNWIRREQVMTLGKFLNENTSQNKAKKETTLFKSVGMALFDVCAAELIYDSAIRKGLGQKIDL